MTIVCFECKISKNSEEIKCTFQHLNNQTIDICNTCYDTINKKLKIYIDLSKLTLLKQKIKMKKINKNKMNSF